MVTSGFLAGKSKENAATNPRLGEQHPAVLVPLISAKLLIYLLQQEKKDVIVKVGKTAKIVLLS